MKNKIDVRQIEAGQLAEKPFPVARPFRIFMSGKAHRSVWKHARSTLVEGEAIREVGGLLVGNVYRDHQGPYLEVKASIVARHTRNEGTEVAFTPETWEQVNGEKDKLYPNDRIVGWYHTHPRFGIFLSDKDKFIQEHSFPQPWATAYVVDPVQQTEGFFQWGEGETQPVPEYWVEEECKTTTEAEPAASQTPGSLSRPSRATPQRALIVQGSLPAAAALALLALVTAVGLIYQQDYVRGQIDKAISQALVSQQAEVDRAQQTLDLIRQVIDSKMAPPDRPPGPQPRIQARVLDLKNGLLKIRAIAEMIRLQVGARSPEQADPPNHSGRSQADGEESRSSSTDME